MKEDSGHKEEISEASILQSAWTGQQGARQTPDPSTDASSCSKDKHLEYLNGCHYICFCLCLFCLLFRPLSLSSFLPPSSSTGKSWMQQSRNDVQTRNTLNRNKTAIEMISITNDAASIHRSLQQRVTENVAPFNSQ